MRQFDVFLNPSSKSREMAPFVVLLQSHFLAAMPTAVVAPMLRAEPDRPAYTEVSVRLTFQAAPFIVSVAELAAIDVRGLRAPVGDLRAFEDPIRRAMERLFSGF
jgi:toxin CcdB